MNWHSAYSRTDIHGLNKMILKRLSSHMPKSQVLAACLMAIPVLTSVVYTTTVQAAVVSETAATQSLNQYLSRLNSMQAGFTQTTQVANKAKTAPIKSGALNQNLRNTHLNQTFTGTMQVKRPGMFRWETTSPSKQLIVTSGKTVWIYDPDLEQAVRQTLDQQVANTPALLLSGQSSQIMKSYRVTQPDSKDSYFVLYPKGQDGVFESLSIRFANKLPSQMILKDSIGQQTIINFNNVKLNPALNNSVFNFVPPKGTDVIDQ